MTAKFITSARASDANQLAQQRPPIAGKVRAGAKVLTKKAAAITAIAEAYEQGLDAGVSFDDIAKAIAGMAGCPQYPMTPSNPETFRVIQSDFTTPGAAQKVLDLYGEIRGDDTEKQLYSFPIVFPSHDLDFVFREQFEAWKTGRREFWSEPNINGHLECVKHAEPDPKNKRRMFGGVGTLSIGPCIPNECDRYGVGDCKHHGYLYFWVPGIEGVGLIELALTSNNASRDIAAMFTLAVNVLKNQDRGIQDAGFRLAKVKKQVHRFDDRTGKFAKSNQWIVSLSSSIDMTAIMGAPQPLRLEAPAPTTDTEATAVPVPVPATPSPETPSPASEDTAEVKAKRAELAAALKALRWPSDDLVGWLTGNGFTTADTHDEPKLTKILGMLAPLAAKRMAEQKSEAPF